jgi:hypothetical protein
MQDGRRVPLRGTPQHYMLLGKRGTATVVVFLQHKIPSRAFVISAIRLIPHCCTTWNAKLAIIVSKHFEEMVLDMLK